MHLDTKFAVDDIVYDRLLKKNVKVIGVTIKHGRMNSIEPTYHCCAEYMITNTPSDSNVFDIWTRTESEIEPIDEEYNKLRNEYVTFEKNFAHGFSKSK